MASSLAAMVMGRGMDWGWDGWWEVEGMERSEKKDLAG